MRARNNEINIFINHITMDVDYAIISDSMIAHFRWSQIHICRCAAQFFSFITNRWGKLNGTFRLVTIQRILKKKKNNFLNNL